MGSETIRLPVIDFCNLKPETPTWESLKTQVRQALEEFGSFEAIFDQIPLNLRKSTLDVIQQIFDLPLEIKLRNKSNKPYHNYAGRNAWAPLYESLAIDDAFSPGKIESFTNLLWPEGNHTFSQTIQSYTEQISELDKIVRRMVLESLGLEKYTDEHIEYSTNYLVRVQKYDVPQSHETGIGLVPHTDKNFVTILYQNEVNGLQVQTKDGQWITAEPTPNSFIVQIGESFHAWTNGRLHPPRHRVMMSGDQARYTIGLFSNPIPGYMVKAPLEMVDEEHPLLFKPYDYAKFLEFLHVETGRPSPVDLKDYCGA